MYLKLRWPRFFTLAGWNWKLFPQPGFDFLITLPDLDDGQSHSLLVRICKKGHDALVVKHSDLWDIHYMYSNPHPALFGDGPKNTHWQMARGDGGGDYTVASRMLYNRAEELWKRAAHD